VHILAWHFFIADFSVSSPDFPEILTCWYFCSTNRQKEEHHLEFLQSMRRAKQAYYAATTGR
jgi:hypothetical protein